MQILPDLYNIKNSIEITEEHTKLHINENNIPIKFDINNYSLIYPKQGIIISTRHWPQQQTMDNNENKQIVIFFNTIIGQNYFHYCYIYFKQQNEDMISSPLSGNLA